ncbi:hypothetical protein [Paraburkholderia solisilvae]|uniref:Uncharacterized protein n=1 Tax=Paraburkholderia solisilvae TaxID=624376 RepID=A0A6J5EGP5_9BURK|nr:hypothetical protein [Paraburkholderia solisilvae]CAB3764205.1 hypothetical protein LMG29739_04275 [Paraburkholderia solisilvae]
MKNMVRYAAVVAIFFARNVFAVTFYEDYDPFYATQPHTMFAAPIKSDSDVVYSIRGKPGVFAELQSRLDGKSLRIWVWEDRITVNGKTYRFANATTFPGEHPSSIYPQSANVFQASSTNGRPALLCLQGNGSGSGEAGRYTQIYLLVDPLAPKSKATFLQLPGLLSSCRAVVENKAGKIAFPKSSYLYDDKHEARVGLLLSYYTFEHRHFSKTDDEIRLRFTEPEIPFRFSVEDRD